SKEPREWSLDDSDTLSYTLTITNESAEPGTYYLTNTATVTENDTREESSDDATVTITVPETVKLKAEVEAEFTWNRERIYEWEIDKKVNPTSVTFDVDEFEKTIEYTITATKTLASEINTHTYSGNAVFTNNGNSQAENAKLLITLQYFDGTWIDLQSETEVILGSIPSGASASYSFGPISFTPVQNIIEYRVKAVAIADAPANSDEAYDSSTLTVTGSTETNASAVLNDSFTEIPEGFAIVETDPDPLPFPQTITENTTVVFEITLAKFFYSGSSSITYEMNKLGAYLKANVTGYMAGEYPGWCTEVGVSGIGTSAVIESIYINGAPDAKYAKINYILNRYRDGLYSTSVDYRHIQIAIWAIMEGYLDWSWRSASGISPEVPYGDKALVENIIATADENFLPGCGDVVLVRAKNASTQDLILEMEFPCGEEYELKNRATLKSETQDLWDDAIVTITLTPTEPEIFDIDLIAGYSMEKNTTYRWEIDKNVTPASAELEKTKSTTFVYTLVADRYLVSVSRKVKGSVVISNTGTGDLLNVSVKITLKGDGTVLNTYETTISLLSAGGSEVVPYSLDLSTGQYSNYTIETRAVEMASGVSDFDSTVLVPTEVKHNETADVRDEFTNLSTFTGNGFAIAPSTNPRIWMDIIRNVLWTAVDSNTWRTSFNIAVTNNTAAPGTYVLNNEVDIYDEDQVFDEDSASITITVRGGTWGEETAWGGNYPGGGSSWWYYFDTNGPSVQDIYAGQNLIQGASVKYDKAMGKLIITLGPNMRLQSVSDPVKVQGYSSIPSSRPEPGTFTTYKGTSLVISVPYYRYFAIHLDVEVWSPSK
ncbi:MAG: hypothetical protein GXY62_11485, partial [Thermotogaceae bacterium]|nr:hypothetical protein [Thermotogaceae bacterium]